MLKVELLDVNLKISESISVSLMFKTYKVMGHAAIDEVEITFEISKTYESAGLKIG